MSSSLGSLPVNATPLVDTAHPVERWRAVADIWALCIPAGEPFSESLDLRVLDGEELHRTRSFVRDVDRTRYAVAHIALRRVLGGYLDVPPEAVRFYREPCPNCGEPHGRPAVIGAGVVGADVVGEDVAGAGVAFSLSHGGDMVLIGVSGTTIGVDVEAWPRTDAIDGLTGALHPAERDEVTSASPDRRTAAFTRLWTRKEAYLKGIGTGLGRGTKLDYVGTGGPGKPAQPEGWTLVDVPAGDGHAAAAAVRTGELRWQLIDLPFDVVRSSSGRQEP